jgi:hypothetical protein
MTAQVIALPVKRPKRNDGPVYYCLRCECDVFTLNAAGEVHCANCTSLIRNLRIEKALDGEEESTDAKSVEEQSLEVG